MSGKERDMEGQDRDAVIAVALMAALADGSATSEEKAQLQSGMRQAGIADLDALTMKITTGQLRLQDLAARLPGDAARREAYELAVLVCHADGPANAAETAFLASLRDAFGLSEAAVSTIDTEAAAVSSAAGAVASGTPPSPAGLDDMILQQAIITGALEILPDRLANLAIIPLQLRLVYQIGQAHGQQMDANQVRDLAGALGIGAAAQVMEGAVRKLLGGAASSILGGLLGGTAGLAAGAAVTFASTYALGHVAKQYYAQGRRLSTADLKALFARFQEEAKTIYPKVQSQVQSQARSLNLPQLLSGLRGS
jgi:uncharacterized protein (DUF697 family)/tellurite resistance protein